MQERKGKEGVYVVAGCKPWNLATFEKVLSKLPGKWSYIGTSEELTLESLRKLDPRYVFFLNWSWKVPEEIVDAYDCVCFHPTDLPFGRGGSPIQNLILRGHETTQLTAFQMTPQLDQGPVYLKEPLSLEGAAHTVFLRFMDVAAQMIQKIIRETPEPKAQTGEVVTFKRRTPEESRIPTGASPKTLYDFIRMLDAPGYPKAFLEHQGLRFELSNASLENGELKAEVVIK